eukprot:jgi/Undpi1/12896/HiC_scaffold_7.g02562.m1
MWREDPDGVQLLQSVQGIIADAASVLFAEEGVEGVLGEEKGDEGSAGDNAWGWVEGQLAKSDGGSGGGGGPPSFKPQQTSSQPHGVASSSSAERTGAGVVVRLIRGAFGEKALQEPERLRAGGDASPFHPGYGGGGGRGGGSRMLKTRSLTTSSSSSIGPPSAPSPLAVALALAPTLEAFLFVEEEEEDGEGGGRGGRGRGERGPSACVSRMLGQVRGLCSGEREARSSSSRRLASYLKEMEGGQPRMTRYYWMVARWDQTTSSVANSTRTGSSIDIITTATLANSSSSSDRRDHISTRSTQGDLADQQQHRQRPSEPSFSAEHVRNLVDVAGSPSLEAALRRSATQQLRVVLLSPGVAAAGLCETILRAALSGLMITPSHAPPTRHATSTFSPPPSSSSTFGRKQSEWDEAFLDFLWAAVSKLPATWSDVEIPESKGRGGVGDGGGVGGGNRSRKGRCCGTGSGGRGNGIGDECPSCRSSGSHGSASPVSPTAIGRRGGGEGGTEGGRAERGVVMARFERALQGAGRRSEFAAAMLEARAWMLSGHGYAEAFFGRGGGWINAFERFLSTPPSSTKDRLALRGVAELLIQGTDYMCPRGFQALADAAEKCFVPILSEDWRPTVLGEFLGDWNAPSRQDSPRDLEAKRRLKKSVLALLVAVVSSPRAGAEDTAGSLAGTSLPERCGPDATTSAWACISVTRADRNLNLLAAAGWGTKNGKGESGSSLLVEISLSRHASGHRSPDSFRGRASLTACLVALQTILATSCTAGTTATPATASSAGSKFGALVACGGWSLSGGGDGSGGGGGAGGVVEGMAAARLGSDEGERLAWLLGLACHRDASVRSLAMGVIAEIPPTSPGRRREAEADEEVIRACVRAASDVYHESPLVVSEALRFLSRHTTSSTLIPEGDLKLRVSLPPYAITLAASLSKSVPPLLAQNAAGPLSVAAASLRFVVTIICSAFRVLESERMMMFESNGGDRSAGGGGGGSVGGGGNMQRVEKGLGRLMEVLWSSGCLEACVYILGEVPDSARGVGSTGRTVRSPGCSSLVLPLFSRSEKSVRGFTRTGAGIAGAGYTRVWANSDSGNSSGSRGRKTSELLARVAREICATLGCLLSTDVLRQTTLEPPTPSSPPPPLPPPPPSSSKKPLPPGSNRRYDSSSSPSPGSYLRYSSPTREVATMVAVGASDLLSAGSGIPQAVFMALEGVLSWPQQAEKENEGGGRGDSSLVSQVEARRLLSLLLSIPKWKHSLDLSCGEAVSLTKILLREEAASLSLLRSGGSLTQGNTLAAAVAEVQASGELHARCLAPLMESSETLRGLALSSGLIGDLTATLEDLLGGMATAGHGLDTIKSASKSLETLKAGMGAKRHQSRRGRSPPAAGSSSSFCSSVRIKSQKKPQLPSNTKVNTSNTTTQTPNTAAITPNTMKSSKTATKSPNSTTKPPNTKTESKSSTTKPSTAFHKGGGEGGGSGRSSPAEQHKARSGEQHTSSRRNGGVGSGDRGGGAVKEELEERRSLSMTASDTRSSIGVRKDGRGKALERQFYMAACLAMSIIDRFPEAQAWPVALASEISRTSSRAQDNNGGGARLGMGAGAGAGGRQGGSVLLLAVLGLSGCLARGFTEGKRSFIFAGSEAPRTASPNANSGHDPVPEPASAAYSHLDQGSPEAPGEWPRSSRSLLHRVASLALSGSATGNGGGSGQGYGNAACEAACDVVRSCVLSSECRTVLAQSGFFADAVAQISLLCGKQGARGGVASLSRAARRAGDLVGVLVNASLRPEGQKALTQVAVHRDPMVTLSLRVMGQTDPELARAAASCLRAALRGGCRDGGGKTAVGVGGWGASVGAAVDSWLSATVRVTVAQSQQQQILKLRKELLAVKDLLGV